MCHTAICFCKVIVCGVPEVPAPPALKPVDVFVPPTGNVLALANNVPSNAIVTAAWAPFPFPDAKVVATDDTVPTAEPSPA